ncbi:hypothetical protein U8D42_03980 [Mycobacterium europaeum]|uniref:hypothetical protein n=1 Tax=Mycobacterium europaeum TaxID=761804 RepID=UPI002AE03B78|nr:hypothetical protein [Mycobacterium europaeum]MEA1159281.1 hypothetical protein [Mycobacterium europaeum]
MTATRGPDRGPGPLTTDPATGKVVPTPHDTEADTRPQHRVHSNARRPRLGMYACGWRAGFAAGAADALRVAGRRLPVETWHIIEVLADQYELAADD